ncbi:DUF2953 domain-containing protein [Cohnella endophytica]|nr:DUF2953 domain-containing protein [Cohnella endophytica]
MAFWLWSILAVLIIGIAGALFSRIRVRVRYSRSGKLDQLVIVVQGFYGLFHHQILVPSIVFRDWGVAYSAKREGSLAGQPGQKKRIIGKGTITRNVKAYRSIMRSTNKFRKWARQSLKKVECTRWRLDFKVGTGDAASTAFVTGLLWAASGCASGAVGQFLTLKTSPHGSVVPNYSAKEFTIVWEADFRIRLGTALASFFKLGRRTIRLGKALRAWRSWSAGPRQA